jgi:hypothetical protein
MSTVLRPDRASTIMGKNFFGIEEATKHFSVSPTRDQIAALSEIPFSETVVNYCKETHILVALFPISILDIFGKLQGKNGILFYQQDWYVKQPFAKDKGEIGWQLIRKTQVPSSSSKNWNEQRSLLGRDDKTPTAQVLVYGIIGHYLHVGERLFRTHYVRTLSLGTETDRVLVGRFNVRGLRIYDYWDGYRYSDVGISCARKAIN